MKTTLKMLLVCITAWALAALLIACGGDGGGGSDTATPQTRSVTVSPTGEVTITGYEATQLVQYCRDQNRAGCAVNIYHNPIATHPGSATFQLNMATLSASQNAFNFMKGGEWFPFSVPDSNLVLIGNVTTEMGSGGANFYFIAGSVVGVYVSVAGEVTITGYGATQLVQYCRDQNRAGCAVNIYHNPIATSDSAATFQLDMNAIEAKQDAFNFIKGANWFLFGVPDTNLVTDGNVATEMGSGGANFYYKL